MNKIRNNEYYYKYELYHWLKIELLLLQLTCYKTANFVPKHLQDQIGFCSENQIKKMQLLQATGKGKITQPQNKSMKRNY